MRRLIRPDAMRRLRLKAHARGARTKVADDFDARKGGSPFGTSEWDVSGNCQRPVLLELFSRPELRTEKAQVIGPGKGARLNMDMHVRCRQCETCLRARAAHWRYRARAEWLQSPRTWLVTLTFSPEQLFRLMAQARHKLRYAVLSFEQLAEKEQFAALERETGREVTLFLKRLRKGGDGFPGVPCRYLLVAEAHKSGAPHYHVLVHEVAGGPPIRHAAIKRAWSAGFSDAKLVKDERAATYATKYLTKSSLARVRASFSYGIITSGLSHKRDSEPCEKVPLTEEGEVGAAKPRPEVSGEGSR